ncbi:MAG TPA: DUF4157 domain-containing protein, partial [Longimicrobium sp.]|nr:DUF4157 domain-containing protein [Longimicrobium sp.]
MERQQTTRTEPLVNRAPDRPTSGTAASVHPILSLQRRVGNQAAARIVQAKLRVGPPGDVYEQEADRVADDVMRMPEGGPVAGVQRQAIRAVQAKCADCEREEAETARTLQRAPIAATEDDEPEEEPAALAQREERGDADDEVAQPARLAQREAREEPEEEPGTAVAQRQEQADVGDEVAQPTRLAQRQEREDAGDEVAQPTRLAQREAREEPEEEPGTAVAQRQERGDSQDEVAQPTRLAQREEREDAGDEVAQPTRLAQREEREDSADEVAQPVRLAQREAREELQAEPAAAMAQRAEGVADEDEAVQPLLQASAARAVPAVSAQVESRIGDARGGGDALPPESRAFFESRFGSDFSGVRVHTDSRATSTSRELGARAFTVGTDIFFGEGEYRPDSAAGRRLLAHELTHVVQQGGGTATHPAWTPSPREEPVVRHGDELQAPEPDAGPPAGGGASAPVPPAEPGGTGPDLPSEPGEGLGSGLGWAAALNLVPVEAREAHREDAFDPGVMPPRRGDQDGGDLLAGPGADALFVHSAPGERGGGNLAPAAVQTRDPFFQPRTPAAATQPAEGAHPLFARARPLLQGAITFQPAPGGLLLQRQTEGTEGTATPQSGVTFWFSVSISRVLDADQLLIEVVRQYLRVDHAAAARAAQRWRWRGEAPTVTEEHVRQGYILVRVHDPNVTAASPEERRERGEYFAGLSAQDQSAINAETDRQFWERTRYRPGQRLGHSRDDQAMAGYWRVLRDELVRQRQSIEALPEPLRRLLFDENGTRTLRPQDYATVLRIAARLSALTPAELADYRSKVNAETTDWSALEASVERYLAERAARRQSVAEREAIRTRLYGLEDLYRMLGEYRSLQTSVRMTPARDEFGVSDPVRPQMDRALRDTETRLLAGLRAHGFASIEEFEAAIRQYADAFERETVAIAGDLLARYEHLLFQAERQYRSPAAVQALYRQLAGTQARRHYEEAEEHAATAANIRPDPDLHRYMPGEWE